MKEASCLHCGSAKLRLVLSLGQQPLANSYLSREQLARPEPRYPLDLFVCESCMLTQINVVATSQEIFSDYAYFSSFSTTWVDHARRYVAMAEERFKLGANSFVIEIASNDGYLLQYVKERDIPCLGIEPAANIATVALEKGIPTEVAFWGKETASTLAAQGRQADLIIGNNVLAHVPTLNDFIAAMKIALKPGGSISLEFPHLMRLVDECQFDTIYHEHFSYFALLVVQRIFAAHELKVYDVEELPTHGGSLRVYAAHAEDEAKSPGARVLELLDRERTAGLDTLRYYEDFAAAVEKVKRETLDFLRDAKASDRRVAAYGAPAKGNTFLNFCGIDEELVAYTVDRSPHKQGLYLPGSHIPILTPEHVATDRPDFMFILPWNLKDEISEQMAHIREWGGEFIVAIPSLRVFG